MLDVFGIKFASTICYNPDLSIEEKIARIVSAADGFADIQIKPDMELFCIAEEAILATAEWISEVHCKNIDTILQIYEKRIQAMQKMMRLAEKDEVLMERIQSTYKTNDLVSWMVDRIMTSQHQQYAALRKFPETMEMIKRYRNV
jgi:hypothetical protein